VAITLSSAQQINVSATVGAISRILGVNASAIGVQVEIRCRIYIASQPWPYPDTTWYVDNSTVNVNEILESQVKADPGTFVFIKSLDHLNPSFLPSRRRKLLMFEYNLAVIANETEAYRIFGLYQKGSHQMESFFSILRSRGVNTDIHSDITWANPITTLNISIPGINSTLATSTLNSPLAIDILSSVSKSKVIGIASGPYVFAPFPPPSPSPSPPLPPPGPPRAPPAPVTDGLSVHQGLVYFFSFLITTLVGGGAIVRCCWPTSQGRAPRVRPKIKEESQEKRAKQGGRRRRLFGARDDFEIIL
jgi:hypothetical protein